MRYMRALSIPLALAVVGTLTLTGLPSANAHTPSEVPAATEGGSFKNIGSARWFHNRPHTYPTAGSCPRSYPGLIKASERTRRTSDGRWYSYEPVIRKGRNVTVRWAGGGWKTVPEGTWLCRTRSVLTPTSRMQLLTWTFATGRDIFGLVEIDGPPQNTCIPATVPAGLTTRVTKFTPFAQGTTLRLPDELSDMFYDYTQVGPPSRSGVYSFEITARAGTGQFELPTLTTRNTTAGGTVMSRGPAALASLNPDGSTTFHWTWVWTDDISSYSSYHDGQGGTGQYPVGEPARFGWLRLMNDCGISHVPDEFRSPTWVNATNARGGDNSLQLDVNGASPPFTTISFGPGDATEPVKPYPPA